VTRAQRLAIFLLLLGGGAAAYAGQRRTAAAPGTPSSGQGGALDWPALDTWSWIPVGAPGAPTDNVSWTQANAIETAQKEAAMNPTDPDRNVRALLDAIAYAEGTANQPDPYRVCYAYSHTIQSFADHPTALKEWPGVVLTAEQCRGAGLGPGCKSTAAGKYQITLTTWRDVKPGLGLTDFTPASQDRAAIELLRRKGALDLIRRGDLAGALSAARSTWASLPGANYAGQGMRTSGQMVTAYLNAGGSLA